MNNDYQNLSEEVLRVVKEYVNRTAVDKKIDANKQKEIIDFLSLRFGVYINFESSIMRINEFADKYPEFSNVVKKIDVNKYR